MTGIGGPPNSQPPPPELVLRQGPQPGQRFPLNQSALTIGREAGNDVVIGDAEVSRRHASLTWDGNHWIIEDLGSANGTVVNGTVIAGPKVLQSGDVIGLAQTVTLALESPVGTQGPAPPDHQPAGSAYPDPAQPPAPAAPAATTHVPSPAPRSVSTACIVIPVVVLLGVAVVLAAAAAGYYYLQRGAASRPVVLMRAPNGGKPVDLGQEVTVQSVARDPQKLRRVELWIDGELQKAETSKVRGGTSPFPLLVRWQPETAGSHTLLTRAFNTRGGQGQSSIDVEVIDEPDQDEDGVVDKADACSDTPGSETAAGCPDRDIDGTTDDQDACPDSSGLPDSSGCPSPQEDDRDGDGLLDVADTCPDQVGPPLADGCPDVDRDGVLDTADACPNEPGLPERAGCPLPDDRDADGVPDPQDVCPDQQGGAQLQGCPDRDGDGARDLDDQCPGDWGEAQLGGCPDQDRDGVPDREDPCPHEAGSPEAHGCPDNGAGDRDEDGIPDDGDLNRDEWGPPENGGAPDPGAGRDADEDGVPDAEEAPDDPVGRIDMGGFVVGQPNAVEFQALEFEVDRDYDEVSCYASLAGSDMVQYGPFQPLAERQWDLAEALGGRTGVYLAIPEGEPLEIRAECQGRVIDDGPGGQGSALFDLGSIREQHPPEDWDTVDPEGLDAIVFGAESEGGDEGHRFRVRYGICSGTCDPSDLAPPVIEIAEILGEMRVHWQWVGDRDSIGAFKTYAHHPIGENVVGLSAPNSHSRSLDGYLPSCEETISYHVVAVGQDWAEYSPPSNIVSLTGGECERTVRITFYLLRTGDHEDAGPISGYFEAFPNVLSRDARLQFRSSSLELSQWDRVSLKHLFQDIEAARAACEFPEDACPPEEAPQVNFLTLDLGPETGVYVFGEVEGEWIEDYYLYKGYDLLTPDLLARDKHDIPMDPDIDLGAELRVLIDEIDGP